MRSSCIVLSVAICLLLGAASLSAQGSRRVAGVSVSVSDVRLGPGGQEADLTVQLTTVETPYGARFRAPARTAEGLQPAPQGLHYAALGQMGDRSASYAYGPYVTTLSPFTFSIFVPPTQILGNIDLSGTIQYSYLYRIGIDGGLPAIDYGDGVSVPATTLPLLSSASTGGGGTRRVFRGSFTHTYGAPGDYTVRVASACCPGTGTTPYAGTPVTAGAYPAIFRLTYSVQLRYNLTGSYSIRYINSTVPSTSTLGPLPAPSGTVTYDSTYTYPITTPGYPIQMIGSAFVPGLSTVEVPLSSGGLLALASLLALAGLLALRR